MGGYCYTRFYTVDPSNQRRIRNDTFLSSKYLRCNTELHIHKMAMKGRSHCKGSLRIFRTKRNILCMVSRSCMDFLRRNYLQGRSYRPDIRHSLSFDLGLGRRETCKNWPHIRRISKLPILAVCNDHMAFQGCSNLYGYRSQVVLYTTNERGRKG